MEIKCTCNVTPETLDLNNLPECQAPYEIISIGDVKGIFQLESYLGKMWGKKLAPKNIREIEKAIDGRKHKGTVIT